MCQNAGSIFRLSVLSSCLSAAFAPPLFAQTLAQTLPEVTVSATRERRNVDETTSTVTVIPAAEIDERFVKDIRDLVRNEPGVTVRRAPTRFSAALGATGRDGNAGFNIRGLEGNRVLIQVDGIRVPAAFSFGASNFGRGGYTDVSTVRSIEILRGPASSLYGSDGLAGVVSFFTFDPIDLLGDQPWHASAAALYASEAESTTLSLRGAARVAGSANAGTELMAIATGRYAHELENFGTNEEPNSRRTAPNPQDNKTGAFLIKGVQRLSRCAVAPDGRARRYDHRGRCAVRPQPSTPDRNQRAAARCRRRARAHPRVGRCGVRAPWLRLGGSRAGRCLLPGQRNHPAFDLPELQRRYGHDPEHQHSL